jgi:acyl-CoA dehydrogenase
MSKADQSDWMFCLVRTDPDVKKQAGISLVLFDMKSEGVTVRPVRLISGASQFCEAFLENVRVEKDQVVGDVNNGWTIAKYLLTHEREMIGGIGNAAAAKSLGEEAVAAIGLNGGRLADEALRAEVAEWEVDFKCHQLTTERVKDEIATYGVGNTSAMIKYYGTEMNMRRFELLIALQGADALQWNDESEAPSEIQLNIIAKRILELG